MANRLEIVCINHTPLNNLGQLQHGTLIHTLPKRDTSGKESYWLTLKHRYVSDSAHVIGGNPVMLEVYSSDSSNVRPINYPKFLAETKSMVNLLYGSVNNTNLMYTLGMSKQGEFFGVYPEKSVRDIRQELRALLSRKR